MWTSGHEVHLAATMVNVLEDWHNVDVLQSDVDAYLGVTEPEEVRLLFNVSHVVGRLQVSCIVEVFNEQIVGMFHTKPCQRNHVTMVYHVMML